VIWDPEFQTIYAQKDDVAVGLMIGSNRMFRNGVSSLIDVAPVIVGGRTLVPTRLIAESFGATVNWDPETRTVEIISYSS
jgi:iron complex transport system substrate-binding protein